jgi:hypothetical protein
MLPVRKSATGYGPGGICRVIHFSKKCALTSPANGASLDTGGPPVLLYSRSRLIGRRRAEVRSLLVCAFLSLPSAYDPQDDANPSPIDASPNSKEGASSAPSPIGARAVPPSREGREWSVAPAECVEKPFGN